MEQERFDQLARGLAAGRSRRGMVRQLAGAVAGGALAAVGVSVAVAKPQRKHDRRGSHHPPARDAKAHKPQHGETPPADDRARRRKKKHHCPAGQTRCNVGAARHGKPKKACVDLQTDHQHCGACGHACPSDQTCQAGQCHGGGGCTPDCHGQQCGSDGCGGSCGTCPAGSSCQQGQCVCLPACAGQQCGGDGCGGNCGTCPSGTHCQQGQCVTIPCDGGCGSHGSCRNGECVCEPGYQTCGTSALCAIDTQTDASNCGACGTVCPVGASCQDGECKCPVGQAICNNRCIDTQTDPANCGACGNVCPAGAGAHNPGCSAGACALICDAGWADCNNNADDGCETPLGAPSNCLQCGDNCAHFADECNAPVCETSGCGATPTNEGLSCQGGTGTCSNGACVPATCIEALQPCVEGGATCCEGRVCQAFSPGCWGPRYCCRASGEPCTNACDCCSATCAGPWINGVGTCP